MQLVVQLAVQADALAVHVNAEAVLFLELRTVPPGQSVEQLTQSESEHFSRRSQAKLILFSFFR